MSSTPRRQGVCALIAFVVLAVVQAWPLPRHLSTHLTGPPTGDTGVYVWNTWVFRHELVELGRSPFTTSSIFSLSGNADLSLHNYTVFADALALPLQPFLGVVGAFNVIYLLNIALAGFGMFLLARRLTGRPIESWIAGAVFACAPFLVARSTAHFSLVAVAPLPFFAYWLDRALETRRLREAAATGVCMAWAAYCDPYYAVYCVMLGACLIAAVSLEWSVQARRLESAVLRGVRRGIDASLVMLGVAIAAVWGIGGGAIHVGGISISMHTLYTPVLGLTVLALARLAVGARVAVSWTGKSLRSLVRPALVAIGVTTLLVSPVLYGVAMRFAEGRAVSAPILWRSSPPGVDLLAFVAPNPTHSLAPAALRDWTTGQPGGFAEQVAAVSLVGLAVILCAWRFGTYRPSRLWLGVTGGFAWLALGPFLQVAGVNTYVPTPWAFLRYLPLVGEARMPSRFAVVAMLGFCVLLAGALVALSHRYARARRPLLAAAGLALALELLPIPRTLYSARIPAIYDIIASDPRPVRVLELPYGVRDGLSSLGNFNAVSQFNQTRHGKPIGGGYLSRVSARRKAAYRQYPVRGALLTLSEGRPLTPAESERAQREAAQFLTRWRIGYVVMDTGRMPPALRRFAIETLGITRIADADGYELYVPVSGPL